MMQIPAPSPVFDPTRAAPGRVDPELVWLRSRPRPPRPPVAATPRPL